MGIPGEFHGDHRLADSRSLCVTSDTLAEGIEILGNPEFNLVKTSDKPEALFSVRFKTRIYHYIKPVTETKCSSDALKILLDRF